ncbi:alpha/beta hydrolase [Phenylobacterium sp.]|uniref:alpha/beta fold hydrolase n=1 Tax=Phenylobacterium sp. TaxID=1871053 RepID=UPI0025ED10F9|nr:alpha/beta hydrolase [Phenylobacterium sp.]
MVTRAGAVWRAGSVPVWGGHLAYHRTGGDGPTLVLSHGLTDSGLCWTRLARALEAEFDVVMLDARGHGDSARLNEGAPHDPARDLGEAIEALGLPSPIVMGHSVGARATAAYANTHPGRVAKVILEDPPFLPLADAAATAARSRKFRDQVERFQAMTEAEIMSMGRTASPGWHDGDLPAWAAAKRQVDPGAFPAYVAPWQAQIDRIDVPTLLIGADPELGSLVTPAVAAEATGLNANIRTVRIGGAGHNVRRENFPDYLAAVLQFLHGA